MHERACQHQHNFELWVISKMWTICHQLLYFIFMMQRAFTYFPVVVYLCVGLSNHVCDRPTDHFHFNNNLLDFWEVKSFITSASASSTTIHPQCICHIIYLTSEAFLSSDFSSWMGYVCVCCIIYYTTLLYIMDRVCNQRHEQEENIYLHLSLFFCVSFSLSFLLLLTFRFVKLMLISFGWDMEECWEEEDGRGKKLLFMIIAV